MSDDYELKGLDDVPSNNEQRCVCCGIPITQDNESGWEVFVDEGHATQPLCAWCEPGYGEGAEKDDPTESFGWWPKYY